MHLSDDAIHEHAVGKVGRGPAQRIEQEPGQCAVALDTVEAVLVGGFAGTARGDKSVGAGIDQPAARRLYPARCRGVGLPLPLQNGHAIDGADMRPGDVIGAVDPARHGLAQPARGAARMAAIKDDGDLQPFIGQRLEQRVQFHIAQILRRRIADVHRHERLVKTLLALEVREYGRRTTTVTGVVDVDLVARLCKFTQALKRADKVGVGRPVAFGQTRPRRGQLEQMAVFDLQHIAQKRVYLIDVTYGAAQLGVADAVDRAVVVIVDANHEAEELLTISSGQIHKIHISRIISALGKTDLLDSDKKRVNAYLRFLSRIGHKFKLRSLSGIEFTGELFFSDIEFINQHTVVVKIQPV